MMSVEMKGYPSNIAHHVPNFPIDQYSGDTTYRDEFPPKPSEPPVTLKSPVGIKVGRREQHTIVPLNISYFIPMLQVEQGSFYLCLDLRLQVPRPRMDLGVEKVIVDGVNVIEEDVFHVLIPALNAPPTKGRQVFTTVHDDQTEVRWT